MSVIIRQEHCPQLEDVARQLAAAFSLARDAIDTGESVVLVVEGPDLLGQGTLTDAAVATGMLGLMRALTFEGGSKGWHVNLVAVDPGSEPDPALLDAAASIPGLTGQVLNASAGHTGKIVP